LKRYYHLEEKNEKNFEDDELNPELEGKDAALSETETEGSISTEENDLLKETEDIIDYEGILVRIEE
jgi:hypothetical protein